MRSYSLIFVAFATVLLCAKYINAEDCVQENCITSNKCEEPARNLNCKELGTMCCSIIKPEYRTHCRHHGGACMENCASSLQRESVDCPDQVCCVLV